MKNYSSNRAQKGKTAYRTPSRWIKGKPELLKKNYSHLKGKKFQETSYKQIPNTSNQQNKNLKIDN